MTHQDADGIGSSGRLEPIAALFQAARNSASDLGVRLESFFPQLAARAEDVARGVYVRTGEQLPSGMGSTAATTWGETALFAASSVRPPMVSIASGEPFSMTSVAGTPYWLRLETVPTGRVLPVRYSIDGEFTPISDVAAYSAHSYELPNVQHGTISDTRTVVSEIYPGVTTEYWVYANHGIDDRAGAPVMIWTDGNALLAPADLVNLRIQIVTDNLVHLGLIPPMAHLLVAAGRAQSAEEDERARLTTPFDTVRMIQYGEVSTRYARHLLEELLPHAEQLVRLRQDGYSRAVAGSSAGCTCAFVLAWLSADSFSRAHLTVGPGAFSDVVRSDPKRNIRVWLSGGSNDFETDEQGHPRLFLPGGIPLNTIMLANALKGRGYDFHFRFGEGAHSFSQAALDLPESLAWLWRDYDPDRTRHDFRQEPSERAKPLFRVAITNRSA